MRTNRVDRAAIVWGALFTLTGGAFLLQAWGVWRVSADLLLPALLIVAGIAVLSGGWVSRPRDPGPTQASLSLEGAVEVGLGLSYGAGTLRVGGGAAPGLVYDGTFAGGVRQEARRRHDRLDVALRHAADAPRALGWSRPLDWVLRLAEGVPIDLEVTTGASRIDLDLTDVAVRSLRIASGASDIDVTLPAHGSYRVEIDAAAADVAVRVPPTVAASVRTSSALSAMNIDPARFPRVDGVHRSPGYDLAADRAEIEIDGALASFAVR